ncbi:MAG: glycosyltransferase family 4 protein [Anaerolineae bacterium]|jgi:glycosyltransferase involved in cell wall biosynthesis
MRESALSAESFTVAFLPVYQNPYQHLLTAELEKQGVHVEHLAGMPPAAWLIRHRDRVPLLHLHWLYGLYMEHLLTPLRLAAFLARFYLARRLGYRFVWTVHNLLPHRQPFPPLHRLVRRLVMDQASAVITHCEYGRREILRLFPSQVPVHVVPHGNYAGVHPLTVSRAEARARLEIEPQQFVYALLGNISAYKGVESFVESFQSSAGPDAVALIAGRNRAPALVDHLQDLAAGDARLQLHAGFIPDDEMQHYLRAADVAIFCFREVLTSGSVILAMTYGLPVIAPERGCLPELVTPDAGLLYDPDDPAALGSTLCRIRSLDTAEMGREAGRIAAAMRWQDVARQTAAIYRDCIG